MALRILVVDDSPIDRELTCRALTALAAPPGPAEVACAGDWNEARPLVEAGELDLVLLDYHLPGLTGLDILREIRRRSADLPVIMLTGQDDVSTAVTALREGACDYVGKSATWGPGLCLAIDRVMARVRLERELAAAQAGLAAYAADLEQKVAARTAVVHAQAAEIEELFLKSEEAARLKAEILANVSHELRTPLNLVMGYTDLLEGELGPALSPEAHQMLRTVRMQAQRLHELVEALLALRPLQGGEGTSRSRFTLGALVDELRGDAVVLNADKGLELRWSAPDRTIELVNDREKVRAIAYHLVSNAIKFTPAGRVDVRLAATPGGGLQLTVSDTGIGLPPEARGQIFEDFRQLDGSTTRRYGGLGIGLGIVKRYAGLLGGSLRVDSIPGEGTLVTVELPGGAEG